VLVFTSVSPVAYRVATPDEVQAFRASVAGRRVLEDYQALRRIESMKSVFIDREGSA